MGALKYEEHYTLKDYARWEGDWELIGGHPYAMSPSPLVTHQTLSIKIAKQLDTLLENCLHCQALFEIDWEISNDTVVRPDTIVICYEPDERITQKPEIIFEIVSPTTKRKDETIKFELYKQEGVAYYVIVYPETQIAKVFCLDKEDYRLLGDFHHETHTFLLQMCHIAFDFSTIWRKKK